MIRVKLLQKGEKMMKKRIAVVTGSSGGFGLLISLELAKQGFYVVATMRNIEKQTRFLQEAEKHNVREHIVIQQLDVTSAQSISNFQSYISKLGRVDVLINNAGFAAGGFVEEIPLQDYRRQFETNVFGVIAVTQTVLPIMRKQQSGQIINISSISGRIGFPGLSPYVASKHALEGWSESLRLEMLPFGIDVVLVEPGSYATNIWSTGKEISPASLMPDSPYSAYMETLNRHLSANENTLGDPIEIAHKIVHITKQKHPSLRYPIGKGVKFAIQMKHILPWQLWERIIRRKLK
jgi:NAD(P)-dependent dehydrogenase (short-subunit alcohol dehydrogenase family)